MAKILYQGHGSLRLISRKGTVVYIDPYAGSGYDIPADVILVSHEHADHNQVDMVAKKDDVQIFRPANMLIDGEYQTKIIKDVVIKAVPAVNNPNHDLSSCVGYLVAADDFKIYFAGDTSMTDYMKEEMPKMQLDYIFLPIDGVYNMGSQEAAECARYIGAKHVVPIHMTPGKLFDIEAARKLDLQNALVVYDGTEFELCHGCGAGCTKA